MRSEYILASAEIIKLSVDIDSSIELTIATRLESIFWANIYSNIIEPIENIREGNLTSISLF